MMQGVFRWETGRIERCVHWLRGQIHMASGASVGLSWSIVASRCLLSPLTGEGLRCSAGRRALQRHRRRLRGQRLGQAFAHTAPPTDLVKNGRASAEQVSEKVI